MDHRRNLSLFCWLFAQAPQIIAKCARLSLFINHKTNIVSGNSYKNGQPVCWSQDTRHADALWMLFAGSVEGLALPFLLNWMLGDVTNLIGCILTDQLDFQKHLATLSVLPSTYLF